MKVALLGTDLRHSVSPELNDLLFPILIDRLGLKDSAGSLIYDKIECELECDFAHWVAHAVTNGYIGANVTFPYKALASNRSTRTIGTQTGSVNTLRFVGGEIEGISTDGAGFVNALERELPGADLSDIAWHVYGAGGAARATLFTVLSQYKPANVVLHSRSAERANDLADDLCEILGLERDLFVIEEFESEPRREVSDSVFVLQATTLGQQNGSEFPVSIEWRSGDVAYDLVYNPTDTAFLKSARMGGATTIGGLGMLIDQGALSEYFWLTGRSTTEMLLTDEEYHRIKAQLTQLLA